MRDVLKWLLSLIVYAGMIAICVLWRDSGGLIGLIMGGVGFVLRYLEPGQTSTRERLGNGYVGSLIGLVLGLIGGAAWHYGALHWHANPELRALFK